MTGLASVIAITVAGALLVGAPARAAITAGWLDTVYGNHGVATAPGGSDHYPGGGTVDSAGRALVLSPVTPTAVQIQITRFALDGSDDATFGTSGSTALPAGPLYTDVWSSGDGVYVAGIPATGNGVSLVRLSATGVVDTGFGTGGLATVAIPDTVDAITGLTRLDSGDVIIAATHDSAPAASYLAAVNATGGLDTGWNAAGATPGLISSAEGFQGVANDGDKTVVLAVDSSDVARVQRLKADGTIDSGFGVSGSRTLTSTFSGANVNVGSDGNYYVAGDDGPNRSGPMEVVRLTPGGAVDSTFGTSGVASVPLSDCDPVAVLTAVTASYVYVFGVHAGCGPQPIIARLSTAGVLDTTFGSGGFMQMGEDDGLGDRTPVALLGAGVQPSGQPVIALTLLARGDTFRTSALRLRTDNTAPNGAFVPLLPRRVLDTRTGNGAAQHAVGARSSVTVQVGGRGGAPGTGVGAVVLNVTAVTPTRGGYVTVWPTGQARPVASSLNFAASATTPNLVTVPLGSGGQVDLFNGSLGSVQLLADVVGYYREGAASQPGAFQPVAPVRIKDTRTTTRLAAHGTLDVPVAGQGGLPGTGIAAAAVNLTAVSPSAAGYLTAYPSGSSRPATSSLSFATGRTRANLVTVALGADGHVKVYNGSSAAVDVLADVAGYYLAGTPTAPGTFVATTPTRVIDSRTGLGVQKGPVRAGQGRVGFLAGLPPLPTGGASAVVLNATVTQPTRSGYLAYQGTGDWYEGHYPSSSLNFAAGQTVANMVIPDGDSFFIYNGSQGTVQIIADVSGYFLP